MVSDTEPRYRLVDSDGNVVGSLFAEADGTLKLQEGTSGTDNELSFGTDGSLTVEQVSATSVNTEQVSNGPLFAGGFDGADADARLDAALSAASKGDVIYLEATSYGSRTISKRLTLIGTSYQEGTSGSRLGGDWTISGPAASVYGVNLNTNTITHSGGFGSIDQCSRGSVIAAANDVGVLNSRSLSVTFNSGTTGGIADSLFSSSTVTDNGANTVGDIA